MIKVRPGNRMEKNAMKCPSCGKEWAAGVKFCGVDGSKLVSAKRTGLPPTQARVNDELRELLPQLQLGSFREVGPGHHLCQRGSTHVQVQVINFGNKVAVRSLAPVTIGSRITNDLMKFLLNHNAGFMFGAFGVDARGVIGLSHTILASSMDVEELGASVSTVLKTADLFDDQIVSRWGGKTMRQTAVDQVLPAAILRALTLGR